MGDKRSALMYLRGQALNTDIPANDGPPHASMPASPSTSAPRAPSRLESCNAWFMLIDGACGLLVSLGIAILHRSATGLIDSPPYVSLLGVCAGLVAMRAARAGLIAGSVFYALQIFSYYSQNLQFNFRSGLSYGLVVSLAHGALVINIVAFLGLLVTVWIMNRRSLGKPN